MGEAMYFLVYATDRPAAHALRARTKSRHSAHLDAGSTDVRVVQSGPWLDSNGAEVGSLLIIEADTAHAAEAFVNADPYAQAGIFERVEIHPWHWRRGNPFLVRDVPAAADRLKQA
ncbi:YciI family protein [Caballeronia ptereochthonis]|uniref:YciI-like protein n=1 Tax=Caballeronia ptereochthonis TaxID=1777144 RepID=A0A158C4M4_9BURK|nr:YciI family protein [Caballeronia ptereochthonis]SAK76497.1 YciI-like protein [Caballeronia ptereochthonis]